MWNDLKFQNILHVYALHINLREVGGSSERVKAAKVTNVLLQFLDAVPEGCLTTTKMCKSRVYTRQRRQTSSNSCSAGGVLGREGATDSVARRTMMEEKMRERGKRARSFPFNIFGDRAILSSRKGIMHSQTVIQATSSDYIFCRAFPTASVVCALPQRTDEPAIPQGQG